MNGIMTKIWRWFTLADVPINRTKPQCSRCDKPSVCTIYTNVNGHATTRYDCMTHQGDLLGLRRDS